MGRPKGLAQVYLKALVLLLPLLVLYWVIPTEADLSEEFLGFLNKTIPVYFIFVLARLALHILRKSPEAVWTGVFWFPLQSALFFGFGPLVEVYGNDITRLLLSVHVLSVDDISLFRANKLSTTGVWFVLLGMWLHMQFRPSTWSLVRRRMNLRLKEGSVGLCFVLTGAVLQYFVLLPVQWGLYAITVPGAITALGSVTDLGFAIVATCAARGDVRQRRFFWTVWPIHLALSFATFGKTAVVIAMLLPLLGYYLGHRNRLNFVIGLLIIGVVFALYQPLVHYGRASIYERTGTINQASYIERFNIIGKYIVGDAVAERSSTGRQSWWTRLNYAGAQAHAMSLYDNGYPGSTLNNVWMLFVPRVLWPDKPIMTGPGSEFYRIVTGNESGISFLGLSIYGDLYWQFGWFGLVFGTAVVGWILALMASRSLTALRHGDLLMLPAILVALEIALLGPTKYVINGIIGPVPIYIGLFISIRLLQRWFVAHRSSGIHHG